MYRVYAQRRFFCVQEFIFADAFVLTDISSLVMSPTCSVYSHNDVDER